MLNLLISCMVIANYNHAEFQINMLNFYVLYGHCQYYNHANFQINMLNLLYIFSGDCHITMPNTLTLSIPNSHPVWYDAPRACYNKFVTRSPAALY